VITKRDVNIFVSRWDPHTTTSEVHDCIDNILQVTDSASFLRKHLIQACSTIISALSQLLFKCLYSTVNLVAEQI